jgi:hypothetical protein
VLAIQRSLADGRLSRVIIAASIREAFQYGIWSIQIFYNAIPPSLADLQALAYI